MIQATLIDASWWVGGNRERGVGAYLSAFFQKYCPIVRNKRVWVLPPGSTSEQSEELQKRFGGVVVVLRTSSRTQLEHELAQVLQIHQISTLFLASPFERPFSLLDFSDFFHRHHCRIEAIIFDLLPFQFPQQILQTWPQADQLEYRQRVGQLRELDFLWCISPITQKGVVQELAYPLSRTKVLRFGLKSDWIHVPNLDRPPRDRHVSVTISGGEWHKNLSGTIEYFAFHRQAKEKLVIICRVGWKQRLKYAWQAIQLGIPFSVHFVGEVTLEEKWRWLWKAERFLFLSHAEGLGIPLLEAQAAEIPHIVISNALVKSGLGVLVKSPETA